MNLRPPRPERGALPDLRFRILPLTAQPPPRTAAQTARSEPRRQSQNPEERCIGASCHRRVQCTMRASIAYPRALHAVQPPANSNAVTPQRKRNRRVRLGVQILRRRSSRCVGGRSGTAHMQPRKIPTEKNPHLIGEASHVAFKVSAHWRNASLGLRSLSARRQRGEILRAIEG